MGPGIQVTHVVQNHLTLILALTIILIMASAWILFEAFRSHVSRKEVSRLRRKLSDLQMERSHASPDPGDHMVLPPRWIRRGTAATSSDGGCLVLVGNISAAIHAVDLTIRVDGDLVVQDHRLRVGDHVEASGKYGTYVLRLYSTDAMQAHLAIALRSHHQDSERLT